MSTNSTLIVFAALWLFVLLAAVPITRRYRHPDAKPIGSYLLFVIVFTMVAWAVFVFLLSLFTALGVIAILSGAVGAVIVVTVSFALAFLAGLYFIGRKPQQAPKLD